MKVRGERECTACGAQWSYYETGSIRCPNCESLRSVGIDDRTRHTDSPATLDLTPHRARFGDATGVLPEEGIDDLKRDLRSYVRKRGFVRGGVLLQLDDTYLAARELLQTVDAYDRLAEPSDADREHLLSLLAGADAGDRPAPETVPPTVHEARGIAAANAAETYRGDVLTFLDDHGTADGDVGAPLTTETASTARDVLGILRERLKRVESLQGDVDPTYTEALIDAANDIGRAVREDDEAALERTRERILELDP